MDDYKTAIKNADKEKVKIVTCGIDISSNRKVLKIKKENLEVQICLGIYPSDALKLSEKEFDSEIEFIKKNKDKIVAIGEVGLDLKENSPETLEKQKDNLSKFVQLAKELNKPIIIHSRKAEAECIEFLEELDYKKIVMHCFSGNFKLVRKIIENNWMLTIPTSVKNSEQFQKVIEITPIENLFCETDSPFLHPDKKFPNEPANVIESYKKISEIKNLPLKEVEKILEKNYANFFK
ncbi:TatD family hydrolase [Candidatus Pacearchaeota archaeon]|nr:TatD family hydrolase [Candidatus Pacearchaeota archaeon]